MLGSAELLASDIVVTVAVGMDADGGVNVVRVRLGKRDGLARIVG